MKKALIYFGTYLVIQFGMALAIKGLWMLLFHGQTDISAGYLITYSSLASVLIIVLFAWLKWCPMNKVYIESKPWTVIIWCVLLSLGSLFPSQWLQDLMPEKWNDSSAVYILQMMMGNRWAYLAVGLLAPIAEEMVFRGGILRALLSWKGGHWTAIIITSLLFALAHGNMAQMPHAFLIGLLLGWMYYRTGSIIPGLIFHWINNTAAYVISNLMPNSNHLADMFGGNQQAVMMSVLFSLLIFIPALFQLNLRMKRPKE
jgi:membrane protease YdiL (CAAX protease family)